ncbi:endo-1,4-beta-xylanase [Pirellulales bacterium]|nr:endo-1,4-beta-xylanase [Pirellulales bacterium]
MFAMSSRWGSNALQLAVRAAVIVFLWASFECALSRAIADDSPVPSLRGERFRELIPFQPTDQFIISATFNYPHLGTTAEKIFESEFEVLTPGNAFKQTAVHPRPGVWGWKKADAMVEYAKEHGYTMRLHAPISPQCSAWAEEDYRTPKELLQNLEEYVAAVCDRFNEESHVRWVDIVNETVTREGEWFGPKPGVGKWQNPWTQIGFDESHSLRPPLYIKRTFEIANEHGPNLKLLYNQHGGMEKPMWERVKATIDYLQKCGVRIDGVGWQAHVSAGWEKVPGNIQSLDRLIRWTHARDLEFHITENTVWMDDPATGSQASQAATYRTILKKLVDHSKRGVVVWNVWQLCDAHIQRPQKKGTMFDNSFQAKLSYYAVQDVLRRYSATKKY